MRNFIFAVVTFFSVEIGFAQQLAPSPNSTPASSSDVEALRQQASAAGVPISEIGVVAAGEGGARFVGIDGEPLVFARTSFSHF